MGYLWKEKTKFVSSPTPNSVISSVPHLNCPRVSTIQLYLAINSSNTPSSPNFPIPFPSPHLLLSLDLLLCPSAAQTSFSK